MLFLIILLPACGLEETSENKDETGGGEQEEQQAQTPEAGPARLISWIDTGESSFEKFCMMVDGQPFYTTEIQMRPDKMRGSYGWSEENIRNAFRQAASDGFNTVTVPLMWREVETSRDEFDWTILDSYLTWCKDFNMKMELAWFSWSSGGRIQNLWDLGSKVVLRVPDYVCSLDGKSDYQVNSDYPSFTIDWRDYSLRAREKVVLAEVMEHIAQWDEKNGSSGVVIGVQLGNEARSYGTNIATAEEIIAWYDEVGKAVKESRYVVWTRLNCIKGETEGRVRANETLRDSKGTNIDFVGLDYYRGTAEMVKGDLGGDLTEIGKNYLMIMECGANETESPFSQFAAIAGNKAFDYYNFGPVDGNGLYTEDSSHNPVETDNVPLVRARNRAICYDIRDIATLSQGKSLYVFNYSGSKTSSETGLYGVSFTPDATSSQAIEIRHSATQLVLITTAGGTFTFPEHLNITEGSSGHFSLDGNWIVDTKFNPEGSTFSIPDNSCVRLDIEGEIKEPDNPSTPNDPSTSFVVNGGFDDTALSAGAPPGWSLSTDSSSTQSMISTAAKSGGFIPADQPHWQLYNSNPMAGKAWQTIRNLPAGDYTLSAKIVVGSFDGTIKLYAGTYGTDIVKGGKTYQVNFQTGGGDIDIGVDFSVSGKVTIDMDDFEISIR